MKLNNKGFTLVEILATVAIMAILSGVAVAGVTRYLEKTRQKAYEAMEKSVFDAAAAYVQKTGIIIDSSTGETLDIQTKLVENDYLPKLIDPKDKESECGGSVKITRTVGNTTQLDKYSYEITITCPTGHTSTKTFES